MKRTSLRRTVQITVLASLACVLTMFPKVPIGGGYVHFGDMVIYVAAIMLGPWAGAVVGAVGHSLADFLSGYAIFVLPTFVIKAVMGFTIGKIVYKHTDVLHFVIGAAASLVIVTGGYFAAEVPLLGYETALISLASSPIQWAMSMVASALVVPILLKNKNRIGL